MGSWRYQLFYYNLSIQELQSLSLGNNRGIPKKQLLIIVNGWGVKPRMASHPSQRELRVREREWKTNKETHQNEREKAILHYAPWLGLYITRGNRYKRMRQVGSYINYPLSHLCTHAHKCACVYHTHSHPHTLIHITHTQQPHYHVRPLMPPRIFLRVTIVVDLHWSDLSATTPVRSSYAALFMLLYLVFVTLYPVSYRIHTHTHTHTHRERKKERKIY